MATGKYVVGIGGSNFDIVGRTNKPFIMADSNPGEMSVSVGGVTRNIIENCARLGLENKLLSVIGKDLHGQQIVSYSVEAGIDMTEVLFVEGANSSTYMALLDENGDMFVALSDMRIMQNLDVDFLKSKEEIIKNAAAIVYDPDMKIETIQYINDVLSQYAPTFCDPVSCAYAEKLIPYMSNIHTLKPNKLELEVIVGRKLETLDDVKQACKEVCEKGVKRIFCSMGKEGCLYYDNEGNCMIRGLKPVENMVNASGAGDSFMSALVYSYINELSIEKTLDYANAAGVAAVLSEETINPNMSVALLDEIINERG